MSSNYNSENNSDESVNNNDNDNNDITPLILVSNVFSHHAWKYLS